jgi:hypothetical protein
MQISYRLSLFIESTYLITRVLVMMGRFVEYQAYAGGLPGGRDETRSLSRKEFFV